MNPRLRSFLVHPLTVGVTAAIVSGGVCVYVGYAEGVKNKLDTLEAIQGVTNSWDTELSSLRKSTENALSDLRIAQQKQLESSVENALKASTKAREYATNAEQERLQAANSTTAAETELKNLRRRLTEADSDLHKVQETAESIRKSTSSLAPFVAKELLAQKKFDYHQFVDKIRRESNSGAPIGAIVAWPHPDLPHGWRPCDGSSVPFSTPLWMLFRGRFGNPNAEKVEQIVLPDFRGFFFRGLDYRRDEDRDGRTLVDPDRNGELDALGQSQQDSLQEHVHWLPQEHPNVEGGGTSGAISNSTRRTVKSGIPAPPARSSSETRPVNVAVHWILRVE